MIPARTVKCLVLILFHREITDRSGHVCSDDYDITETNHQGFWTWRDCVLSDNLRAWY